MSSWVLRRQLLRMGRAAAWAAEAGRVRFFALFAATFVVTVALAGFALAVASFDGRTERSADRWAQIARPASGEEAELLWLPTIARSEDRQYDVVYVEPLSADAPLPPGVSHWPEPGEVLVSPALKNSDVGAGEFGRVVGTIDPGGLEAPGEYFAYVRPTADLLSSKEMIKVSGFHSGLEQMPPLGEHLYTLGFTEFLWLYATLIGLPAVLFVVIAARVGAAARDRRTAVLATLGASSGARRWFAVGEAALPVAFGGILAMASIAPVLVVDVPLPVVDFVLYAPDARTVTAQLAMAALGAPVAVVAAVVLLQPAYKPGGSTRPALRRRRGEWMLWLFPVALFGTVRGGDFLPLELRLSALAAGSIVTLALLPGVVGAVVAAAGPAMARAGAARGRAGLLIAGRRLAAGPRPVTRLVAALVIAIGLAGQGQIMVSLFTEMTQRADSMASRLGTSALKVTATTPTSPARVGSFQRELGAGMRVLPLWIRPDKGRIDIVADCADLKSLKIPCKTTPVDIRAAENGGLNRAIEMENASGTRVFARTGHAEKVISETSRPSFLVLADDGRQLSISAARKAANTELAMANTVHVFGMNGIGGGGAPLIAERWLELLSLSGISVIAVVAGIGAMSQFIRAGGEMSPVSVISGNRKVYYTVSAWSILTPALVAVLAAVVVSWSITTPLPASEGSRMETLATVGAAGFVCAAVMALWGARTAAAAAAAWRPSGG
ncbi:hypothetical protein [Streptomyces jumonjinensis]|uniref:ABC transporter permease n=1 Tax=Streptomyces jumonjinensis TaxID=1945 RepID=A0A646KED6_STRJU|nr:hypothetical protein [Streptomyces jumonjinensis]MQT00488.1 hypothetical protein [Streptomyces jumonjinensis]